MTLPVQKSVNVDFLAITPASSNRAELTVSDLGFGPGGGTNVLCVGEHVDMKETYTTNFTQTPYVKTFMQNDAGAANLGTITNSGWTIKQNRWDYRKGETALIHPSNCIGTRVLTTTSLS